MDILQNINCNPVFNTNKYIYNGNSVPRVTEILSSMLHEEYLMKWANSLGYKHQNYENVRDNAAMIGTYVHESIESYLKNKVYDQTIPYNIKNKVINAFNSFIEWYNIVKTNNTIKILLIEKQLVCQWFGGTLDLLIEINGLKYLVDFKTSNHVGYKYYLQASAYKYMLELQNIYIDGIIILQLSKDEISFNEYILHMNNEQHRIFIENCIKTFFGLVYSYYYRIFIQQQYSQIFI